ncbi:MAG: hypothetical protein NXI28_21855 [bacterium]|nr:hypothetical protein [bacterium]
MKLNATIDVSNILVMITDGKVRGGLRAKSHAQITPRHASVAPNQFHSLTRSLNIP